MPFGSDIFGGFRSNAQEYRRTSGNNGDDYRRFVPAVPTFVVTRDALIPIENSATVAPIVFFSGGGGQPVVAWRPWPTPDYDARRAETPERERPRRRRRKLVPIAKTTSNAVIAEAIWEPIPELMPALVRLHRRRQAQQVQRVQNLVESDEEFMIITGQL